MHIQKFYEYIYLFYRRKSSPSYLNKTSVRPGLKNCGDVNCIGRILILEDIFFVLFSRTSDEKNGPMELQILIPIYNNNSTKSWY
jgi:hypothetical protein